MKKYSYLLVAAFLGLTIFSAARFYDEGEWLLTQINKLPLADMQKTGLKLSAADIWTPNATSLTSAIVLLPGGTGSFVSNDGLIITNHHIAFGGIQALSSVEDDYLANGFLANAKSDELSCPTYTAEIVTDITDVTKDILGSVTDQMDAEARAKAIQKKIGEMQIAAKGTTDNTCRIFEMYNGVQYLLFTYEVVRDVRLVYAPPGSIGVYGGEVDNWMWPRHTGDFAFLRAYVAPDGKHAKYSKDNVPYHPKKFLPFSSKPLEQGTFAMVMGFPGRTYRYRTASEIKLAKEETLPMTIDWYKKRMDILNAAGDKDRAVAIQYAAKVRSIANSEKNYVGTLEGMDRSGLLKEREADESAFNKYIDTKDELETKYEDLLSNMAAEQRELKNFNRKQFILGQFPFAIDLYRLTGRFNDYVKAANKDSAAAPLKEAITSTFKDANAQVDKDQLVALLLTAADLPKDQQISAVNDIVGGKSGDEREKAIRAFADKLYADSHITTKDKATDLVGKSADEIKADPYMKLFLSINPESAELTARTAKFNAEMNRLRGQWLAARMAWKGDGIYPDANRSLRFSYGTIKPYDPRDAVHYDYMTSLNGVIEKGTGVDPFIVPAKLHQLWEKKDYGNYVDPRLHDVPVAFLADLDITGGNSGSPLINGNGELIGVAFDGNWEAVVGDYYFQENLNRTISVDSRYVLFILDKFAGAKNLLSELVIH